MLPRGVQKLQKLAQHGLSRHFVARPGNRLPISSPWRTEPARLQLRSCRAYSHVPSSRTRELLSRRIFTWGIIGANIYVFISWVSSAPTTNADSRAREMKASPRKYMIENYTLSLKNLSEGRYWTLLSSAFSHNSPGHLTFNMITFFFASTLGFAIGLGPARMAVLTLGSSLSSGICSMLDESTRLSSGATGQGRSHLGASGMIEGLLVAMSLTRPHVPVYIMFIPVPISLWVVTGGFLAWDYYRLMQDRVTGPTPSWTGSFVGYAGHLGGAMFGAAYYLFRLRYKFGGVLPPRRR